MANAKSPMIVAIDGPAAAGKGTLARRLAAHLDFAFLDTGLLYRATAVHLAEARGNRGTPIAALCAIALEAERVGHQVMKGFGDRLDIDRARAWMIRKAVARQ